MFILSIIQKELFKLEENIILLVQKWDGCLNVRPLNQTTLAMLQEKFVLREYSELLDWNGYYWSNTYSINMGSEVKESA